MGDATAVRAGLSVLVVEDNADTADSYAFLFEQCGHRVWVAADGPAAERLAADAPPDVVILDIGLPGIDGYRVAERLRGRSLGKPPFIVAVSGYGTEEDRRRGREVGIDLYLMKPADPEGLLRLLRRFEGIITSMAPAADREPFPAAS